MHTAIITLLLVLAPVAAHARQVLRIPADLGFYDGCLGPRVMPIERNWVVFSDREGVQPYSDSACLQPKAGKRLEFLKPFYVVEEDRSNRSLHLIRSQTSWRKDDIVVGEDIGWVKADNLVLSHECARSDPSRVPKKVFIINSWEKYTDRATSAGLSKESLEDWEDRKIQVRAGPGADARVLRSISGVKEPFAFLYKYDVCSGGADKGARWFLIGSRSEARVERPEDYIIGWVEKSDVMAWDTRIAYEPHPDRVTFADIYRDEPELRMVVGGGQGKPLLIDKGDKDEWPADEWRYVALSLEKQRDDRAFLGFMGHVLFRGHDGETTPGDPTEYNPVFMEVYDRSRRTNIIFVLDCTKSMGPYLSAAADVVLEVTEEVERSRSLYSNVEVLYAAVVYRDLSDLPAEQIDYCDLTTPQGIASFLKAKVEQPSTSKDDDFEEALFEGVRTALTDIACPYERNVLVVIGDAGNNDSKGSWNQQELEGLVEDLPLAAFAIHIRRSPQGPAEARAIQKFKTDAERLLATVRSAGERDRALIRGDLQWDEKLLGLLDDDKRDWTRFWSSKPNANDIEGVGRKLNAELEDVLRRSSFMAEYMFDMLIARDLDPSKILDSLKTEEEKRLFYEATDEFLQLVRELVPDDEVRRNLLSDKLQLFHPGWCMINDPGGRPVLRPTLLVSESDLSATIAVLDDFLYYQNQPNAFFVWRDAIGMIMGHPVRSPQEYITMTRALPFRKLGDFLSKDFDELQAADSDEIDKMVEAAEDAKDRLEEYRADKERWFPNYTINYMWLHLEELP
jgi:hypothetical protein